MIVGMSSTAGQGAHECTCISDEDGVLDTEAAQVNCQ